MHGDSQKQRRTFLYLIVKYTLIATSTLLVLLIGANETMYDANSAIQRLNKVAPHVETALIAGTGYDLMFTHTDVVNRKILDFLKE